MLMNHHTNVSLNTLLQKDNQMSKISDENMVIRVPVDQRDAITDHWECTKANQMVAAISAMQCAILEFEKETQTEVAVYYPFDKNLDVHIRLRQS